MSDLLLQSLPYFRDSRNLMQALAVLPHPVFLDSGLADSTESRYDILTAAPTHFECISQQNRHEVFDRCQKLLEASKQSADDYQRLAHLPFCGGLLGCLSYEIGPPPPVSVPGPTNPALRALPLTALPVAAVGIYDWAIVVDHQQRRTELFILPQCSEQVRQQVLAAVAALSSVEFADTFSLVSPFSAFDSREHYLDAFKRLQNYILQGDCYQANLAMAFSSQYTGSTLAAFDLLRQRSRSPFSAYFDAGEFQLLSLSPERFISVRDRRVFTQPIKGTRKRFADPLLDKLSIDDLLGSEKDRAENLMIVDLLRNDLGAICETGSVKTESLFQLHSFSQVHHLISSISALLPANRSALQLLQSCFPGGSITGAPKIRAMQIIAELESVPRAFYCGSIFYNDYLDRLDSNICIRTLLVTEGHMYCWGGSGVVADSEAELEYQECLDKVSVLMDLPGS